MEKHLYWVDLAKVLGLYLMILGHGNLVDDDLRFYIYSFHMPLFFLVSGLFVKNKDGNQLYSTIVSAFKSLIIPYLCLNMVCLVCFFIIDSYKGIFSLDLLKSELLAICVGIGYKTDNLSPVCTPMWFFYTLFIIKVIYSFVPVSKFSKIIQFSFCFIAVKLLSYYNIDIYIPIDCAIMAYPFYLIGTECKSILCKFDNMHYKYSFLALFILIAIYFISSFNGRCDIDTMRYGNFYSLFIFTGVAATFSILILCNRFMNYLYVVKDKITTICLGASLIVGLNLIAINIVKSLSMIFIDKWNNLYGIFLAFIIMCLFYPLIIVTKKYAPLTLGNRK